MRRIFLFIFILTVSAGILSACASETILYSETETSDEEFCETDTVVSEQMSEETVSLSEEIMVHMCGAVINPGVYIVPQGSRVQDALLEAGGFREDACIDYVNLAEPLTDGSKIMIPTVEQIKEQEKDSFAALSQESNSESNDAKEKLININTADLEQLQQLTGVGEIRARSVIAYREENGAFQSITDIMKVSGIKEASYNKFKDEITVKN